MPPYSPPPKPRAQLSYPPSAGPSSHPSVLFSRPGAASSSSSSRTNGTGSSSVLFDAAGGTGGATPQGEEADEYAYSTTLRRAPSFTHDHSLGGGNGGGPHSPTRYTGANGGLLGGGGSASGGAAGAAAAVMDSAGGLAAWATAKLGLAGSSSGGADYSRLNNAGGREEMDPREQTPSEVFAGLSIEVSLLSLP